MQTNGNTITEPKYVQQIGVVPQNQQEQYNAQNKVLQPNLYGLGTNYAAQNKWFASLPIESVLGKKYSNLDLHLTQFSLPQMVMSTHTVSYRGYQKEIPGKVLMPENKELTLTYIVDENWQNYRALFAWFGVIEGVLNPVATDDTNGRVQPTDYIPLRIYLLDNYKKKIIQFVFENCFIKIFNDLQLDVSNPAEIKHSFTFAYSQYYIEDIGQ